MTETLISDIPGAAESANESGPRGWIAATYEAENGLAGTMLYAPSDAECDELHIILNVDGRHDIYLGFNYTRSVTGDLFHVAPWSRWGVVWAKLDSDVGYSRFTPEIYYRHGSRFPSKTGSELAIWTSIHETFFKSADLTGRSLKVKKPGPPYDGPELRGIANLAWIRLVPLPDEELERHRRITDTDTSRTLLVEFCPDVISGEGGGSPLHAPEGESWFRDELAAMLDNDVGIISVEALRGELCLFPTENGFDGRTAGGTTPWELNPLAEFAKVARESGVETFLSVRLLGASLPPRMFPVQASPFFWSHQELAVRDRSGTTGSHLSLAYPEVRAFWIDRIKEGLACGCTGVHLLLNRSFPFVLFEEPVVEAFIAEHGIDPRTIPSSDPRWLRHQARYLTDFLRELRDHVEGATLAATVHTGLTVAEPTSGRANPIEYGADVERWLDDGIVDILVPWPGIDIETLANWVERAGDRTRILPELMPRTAPATHYLDLAESYYAAGAAGLSLWDGDRRPPRASEWATVRHLGLPSKIGDLRAVAARHWTRVPLKSIDGLSVAASFSDG